MTHDDEQWNTEMFRAVLDRPHCRRIDHIASIAGDKNLADTQPAEQQFGWHAAVGATDHRCPRRLRLGNLAPLLQQVERAKLRRSDEFFVAGFQSGDASSAVMFVAGMSSEIARRLQKLATTMFAAVSARNLRRCGAG